MTGVPSQGRQRQEKWRTVAVLNSKLLDIALISATTMHAQHATRTLGTYYTRENFAALPDRWDFNAAVAVSSERKVTNTYAFLSGDAFWIYTVEICSRNFGANHDLAASELATSPGIHNCGRGFPWMISRNAFPESQCQHFLD